MIVSYFKDPRQVLLICVYAVLLLYPITMFVVEGIVSDLARILLVLSLIAFALNKFSFKNINLDRKEMLVLLSLAMIFVVAFASYAYFGFEEEARTRMNRYNYFLMCIPIFFLFRYTKPKMEIIWIGVVAGCYVAFGRAVLEEFKLVEEFVRGAARQDPSRANGVMNPIRFGDLTILMSFIALSGVLYLNKIPKIIRFIGLIGFLAGVGASILSQTRGALVTFPILLFISIWPFLKLQEKRIRYLAVVVTLSCLLVVLLLPSLGVKSRFENITIEIDSYLTGENLNSAIGIRFFMFETAVNIFTNNKVFGVGIGGYRENAIRYYEEKQSKVTRKFLKWKNPHNEYLLHAATRGIIGLVVLLVSFATGFYYFLKRRKNQSGEYQFSAIAGMLIVTAYAQFGLTIALFEHRSFLVFYTIYLVMFAANRSWVKQQ